MHNFESDEVKRNRLEAILNDSDDAIICKNTQGVVLIWNRAAEKLFGYTREETVGRHIQFLADDRGLRRSLDATILLEEVENCEVLGRTKDGSLIAISVSTRPVRDESGAFFEVLYIIRDRETSREIAARKELRERLRRSEQQCNELLAHLGTFNARLHSTRRINSGTEQQHQQRHTRMKHYTGVILPSTQN